MATQGGIDEMESPFIGRRQAKTGIMTGTRSTQGGKRTLWERSWSLSWIVIGAQDPASCPLWGKHAYRHTTAVILTDQWI